MDTPDHTAFETLAEKILGPGFPPHLAGRLSLPDLPPEARDYVLRLLTLMKRSGFGITQMNDGLIHWLSFTLPDILPGAWEGRIPPITVPGRHKKLDDYIAGQHLDSPGQQPVFLDLGCGFPPVTTEDTAQRFPKWQVCGVDRAFADVLVYDPGGNYACFDREGKFLYFHPAMTVSRQRLSQSLKKTAGKKRGVRELEHRFRRLFETLFPLLGQESSLASETVEKNGSRLIFRHILDFETENLRFIEANLADLPPTAATVIRSMNLFVYFPADIQKKMLEQIRDHLKESGLALIGTNSFGIQSRYAVYRKETGRMRLREFAFSLDNLGHLAVMPWFALHDRDCEARLLADLSFTLRSSTAFWEGFSRDMDLLMAEIGLCRRRSDGFLHFPEGDISPRTVLAGHARLWEKMAEKGHALGAVEALEKEGFAAWLNPAGDIAVRPPPDALW